MNYQPNNVSIIKIDEMSYEELKDAIDRVEMELEDEQAKNFSILIRGEINRITKQIEENEHEETEEEVELKIRLETLRSKNILDELEMQQADESFELQMRQIDEEFNRHIRQIRRESDLQDFLLVYVSDRRSA